MDKLYLVLIETSGNQNYIFSTNKLKENIGASELTYQAGTHWVISAVAEENKEVLFKDWQNPEKLRKMLRDSHAPIDGPKRVAEIIIAASGKALVLTKTQNIARNIISKVTKTALKEAPGLDVSGVYVEIENWKEKGSLAKAIRQVHKEFERMRSRRPSPESRFLRLPIVADCAMSGLPASELEKSVSGEKPKAISCVSSTKRKIAPQATERLQAIAQDSKLVKDINKLEQLFDELSWLAIVHADGNGLGQIFIEFEKYIGEQDNRNYINKYRRFSLALDDCTETAFREALKVLPADKGALPIVPLIIGGDDLTVVCHGKYALEFTRVFLQEFELQTEKRPEISEIAQQVFGVGRLSACAGISIVKRHFPFSVAYDLSEKLIKSAKDVKNKVTCRETEQVSQNTPFPCSAIDFHILYDTSGIELDDVRSRLRPESNTQLYNRPYVVSYHLDEVQEEGRNWAKEHDWKLLSDRVNWLNSNESSQHGKDPVSSAQSHAIRTALFLGKANADAQYQLIRQRYDLEKFAESLEKDSLFHQNSEDIYVTSFLDALDAKDFLKSAESDKPEDLQGDAA